MYHKETQLMSDLEKQDCSTVPVEDQNRHDLALVPTRNRYGNKYGELLEPRTQATQPILRIRTTNGHSVDVTY